MSRKDGQHPDQQVSAPGDSQSETNYIRHVRSKDVLCGRGNGVNNRSGNVNFRKHVDMHRDAYARARRQDKVSIARKVVELIHAENGRFLRIQQHASGSEDGLYEEINKDRAIEKASQALREGCSKKKKEEKIYREKVKEAKMLIRMSKGPARMKQDKLEDKSSPQPLIPLETAGDQQQQKQQQQQQQQQPHDHQHEQQHLQLQQHLQQRLQRHHCQHPTQPHKHQQTSQQGFFQQSSVYTPLAQAQTSLMSTAANYLSNGFLPGVHIPVAAGVRPHILVGLDKATRSDPPVTSPIGPLRKDGAAPTLSTYTGTARHSIGDPEGVKAPGNFETMPQTTGTDGSSSVESDGEASSYRKSYQYLPEKEFKSATKGDSSNSEVHLWIDTYFQGKQDKMYEQLVNFKSAHGHCGIPPIWAANRDLCLWVSYQRQLYREVSKGFRLPTQQEEELMNKLESLGFVWDYEKWHWERRYQELMEFQDKEEKKKDPTSNVKGALDHGRITPSQQDNHGTTGTPIPKYLSLALWVQDQRQRYIDGLEGKLPAMVDERVRKLAKIRFSYIKQQHASGLKRL